MVRMCVYLAPLLLLSACANTGPEATGRTLVLSYQDFGPQVIAKDLIGMQWWQWEAHGDSRPREYDIKVVVYRGMALSTVENRFPVAPDKQQDYRYVEYLEALAYLDRVIAEDLMSSVTQALSATRSRVIAKLGRPPG